VLTFTVSLLLSNFCDSLQLRAFIDGIHKRKRCYVSKTKLLNSVPLFGPLGKQLDIKIKFRQNIGEPPESIPEKSGAFQRGINLHARLKSFSWDRRIEEYGCKYSIRMHDLRHTFK